MSASPSEGESSLDHVLPNRPLEEWGKLIGDVPTATAILDRILHRAEIIQITGKSYRLKDRASKSNRACQEGQKAS